MQAEHEGHEELEENYWERARKTQYTLDRSRGYMEFQLPDGVLPHLDNVNLADSFWEEKGRTAREYVVRDKVFGDRVLANRIFLRLSAQDLLPLGCTNSLFSQAIRTDPWANRSLFLQAGLWTGPQAISHDDDLTSHRSSLSDLRCSKDLMTPSTESGSPKVYEVQLNPLLFSMETIERYQGQLVLNPSLKNLTMLEKAGARSWGSETHSSLLDMWICSPAVPGIEIVAMHKLVSRHADGHHVKLSTFDNKKATYRAVLKAWGSEARGRARDTSKFDWLKCDLRVLFPEGIRFWLNGQAVNDNAGFEEEDW